MEYDHPGMPPPPGHGRDDDFRGEPFIQFDVGQNDHIRQGRTQQLKQKGTKANATGAYNQFSDQVNNSNTGGNTSKPNPNKRPDPVDVQYRGYMLKKAEPYVGEEPSWARVVQNLLPFSNAELAEQSKKVRYDTKTDPLTAYSTLSREQSGVVERIIAKLQNEEKTKNAVWVLDSVKKFREMKQKSWTRSIQSTSKIQIILKRQDKNALKPGQKPIAPGQKLYQSGEVIDLSDPAPKRKVDSDQTQTNNSNQTQTGQNQGGGKAGKVKNNNQQPHQQQHQQYQNNQPQQFQDNYQQLAPPLPPLPPQQWPDQFPPAGEHMMAGAMPDIFADIGRELPPFNAMPDHCHPHGHQQQHQQQPQPPHHPPYNMPPPPPPPPPPTPPPPPPQPPGAIAIDEWDRQQQGHMMQHDQHRQAHHSRPPALRHGEYDDNPFKPNDNVFLPGSYELPPDMQNNRFSQSRPRSFTPGPQYSSRDPSRDRNRYYNAPQEYPIRRSSTKKLQRQFDTLDDKMEEVISKIDDWKLQQQEDAHRDRDHNRGRRRLRDHLHHSSGVSSYSDSDSYVAEADMWASAPASGGSFTPPSTPPLEYLDSSGTLSRRKTISSTMKPRRANYITTATATGGATYRDARGAQIIVEPRTHRHRRRQSEVLPPVAARRSPRPMLHHATTWQGNDYPSYPVAERPIRIVRDFDEVDRDRGRVYVDYGGNRPKYEAGRRRRDSMFVRGGDWEERGGGVYVDGRRGRRRGGHIH